MPEEQAQQQGQQQAQAEPQAQPEQQQQPAQQPATPPGEQGGEPRVLRLTQEELNQIISGRLSRQEAKHQEQLQTYEAQLQELKKASMESPKPQEQPKQEAPEQPKAEPQQDTGPKPDEIRDEFERMRRFDRALMPLGLSEQMAGDLETLYKVEKPDGSIREWAETKLKAWGAGPSQKEPEPEPLAEDPPAPVSGEPRKVKDLETGGLLDVTSLSREDINAMGIDRVKEEFEKVLAEDRKRQGMPQKPKALRRYLENKG